MGGVWIRSPRDFGGAMRRARRESGLTQAEVASRAGVSRRWISELEAGKRPGAELSLIMQTADVFGLQVELHPQPPRDPYGEKLWDAILNGGVLRE
jgi:HTH-type transcriptional regulator/antitoxin HipB